MLAPPSSAHRAAIDGVYLFSTSVVLPKCVYGACHNDRHGILLLSQRAAYFRAISDTSSINPSLSVIGSSPR